MTYMQYLQKRYAEGLRGKELWQDVKEEAKRRGTTSFETVRKTYKKFLQETTPKPISSSREETFRLQFSRSAIEEQRIIQVHSKVNKIIETILKKKEWLPDDEMKILVGSTNSQWPNIRRDYGKMLVDTKDIQNRHVTIWVHPDFDTKYRTLALS